MNLLAAVVEDVTLRDLIVLVSFAAAIGSLASFVVKPLWARTKNVDEGIAAAKRCESALFPAGADPLNIQVRAISTAMEEHKTQAAETAEAVQSQITDLKEGQRQLHADFGRLNDALIEHMNDEKADREDLSRRLDALLPALAPAVAAPVKRTTRPRKKAAS